MARLEWDKIGEHFMELGTDHGVLYVQDPSKDPIKDDMKYHYGKGVVWNGLTGVTLSPEGAEPSDIYADNIKYATIRSAETFGATIEAYTFPKEFYDCDGSSVVNKGLVLHQQSRAMFGFAFRSKVINDTAPDTDDSYKIHLIYGATASPSEQSLETINDSPDPGTFSWEISTTPVSVKGFKPTSHIEILINELSPAVVSKLEDVLYGSDTTEARLPLPDELMSIVGTPDAILQTKITVPDASNSFYGKNASDLQENIKITELDNNNVSVTGTLKHVSGYSDFSGIPSEQTGNYLALNVDVPDGATAKVIGVVNTTPKEINDEYLVFRVTDKTKPFKIQIEADGKTVEKVYDLSAIEAKTE